MVTSVKAYIVKDSSSDPIPGTIDRRDPTVSDVAIDILYCGICHSDLHTAHNDWKATKYPLTPGHEIIGKVAKVGENVTKFKPGDLVGVGCLVNSCKGCAACDLGQEQWCTKRTGTYNGIDRDGTITKGGYSQAVVVDESFVLKIPHNLDPAAAAPLLCAGITTYSPLKAHGAGPGKKVAIVGLGGLGAHGIKLAKALGSEVTLFSRNHSKDAGAKELGADHVVSSTDESEMAAVADTFDVIIDTVPVEHEIDPYIKTLSFGGKFVIVGQMGPTSLNTRSLMPGNKVLAASNIGGIRQTQEMLDLCGEHNITCDIELISYKDISAAYSRLAKGDVKFRFVLDAKTI